MHPTLLVPGWTGFNITVRRNAVIIESNIAYLDTIDSPATDLKTGFEVLCRASEIRDRLNLKAVVCVFGQSFYAKVMEVFWKNRQLFKNLGIMMGSFHLIMMLLGVIGTRFGDADPRELAIESDAIAEALIERVLNDKNYNRSLRLHKIFYEALMILFLLNSFKNSLSHDNAELLAHQKTLIEELKLDISAVGYTNLLQHDDFKAWHEAFQVFMTNLTERGSHLVKFWLSYLKICELVLNLIYATRTGNWTLYLSCIEEVLCI